MFCPACQSTLIVLELHEVEVDYCTECQGIWLDAGELELLLGSSSQAGEFLESFQNCNTGVEKKRKCPICRKKMEKIDYTQGESPILDRCKKGHGLWFDAGELEKILKLEGSESSEVIDLIQDIFGNKDISEKE